MDGIGQHNAIFPATTTGYMHGGVWYPNMLNPMADQFQPTHSAGTPDIRNALATAGVLREGRSSEAAQISARLNNVTEVMVSEMHSLRTDIEKLKQGGWTMTVGPFQHQFSHNQSSAQLTKKTIEPETQHTMIDAVTPGPIARSLFDSIRETLAVEGGATDSAKRPRDGEALSNRFVMADLRLARETDHFTELYQRVLRHPRLTYPVVTQVLSRLSIARTRVTRIWIVLADQLPVKSCRLRVCQLMQAIAQCQKHRPLSMSLLLYHSNKIPHSQLLARTLPKSLLISVVNQPISSYQKKRMRVIVALCPRGETHL